MEAVAGTSPSALPPPEVIRQTASEIVGRPAYELESVGPDVTSVFGSIFRFLGRILSPIGRLFEGLIDINPLFGWAVIIVLLLIAIALIVHIVLMFARAVRVRRRRFEGVLAAERAAESLPETWELRAREAFSQRDYIRAIRYLFRAGLLRLEAAQERSYRHGATNREYLRRFRDTPAGEPMRLFVDVIDCKWYGGESCLAEDYRQCADAHARICRVAGEMGNAHGP